MTHFTKCFQTIGRVIFLCLLLSVLFVGCASLKKHELSESYDKSKYRKMGLLVCRMGNKHEGYLAPITLETDYSLHAPKRELSSGALYMKEHQDIYIESADRLKASIPNYPYIRYRPESWSQYFRNITAEIYAHTKGILKRKGYKVVDVKKLSSGWTKPISELNISNIIERSKSDIDALLVFHYLDVGAQYIKGGNQNRNGFSELWYSISIFDAVSKERVLLFRQGNFAHFEWALSADPQIQADPSARNKIRVEESPAQIKLISTFTDDEVLHYVMKYVQKGCVFKRGNYEEKWKGLQEIIP